MILEDQNKEVAVNEVRVIPEGKLFKVLVNFIQRGITYSSPQTANREAERVANYEHRKLILFKEKI